MLAPVSDKRMIPTMDVENMLWPERGQGLLTSRYIFVVLNHEDVGRVAYEPLLAVQMTT